MESRITLSEAGLLLGMTSERVRRLIQTRELAGGLDGGRWWTTRPAVADYEARERVSAERAREVALICPNCGNRDEGPPGILCSNACGARMVVEPLVGGPLP